jgi:eukaryotic-like serine/threonine-protein kinase
VSRRPDLDGASDAFSDLLLALASAPERDPAGLVVPLAAGDVVGRFELLREVGRGGFGVVFEAKDRELGRLVAFKAMRPSRARADALEKPLREEAEAAARLNHPNVVTLHDFGIHEGTPYLILELLRGETLQQRLARGPLAPGEAIRVALDVARGLEHAHGRGVLHRDLKPGNVFLTEGGGLKLLDFGLARLLDRASLAGGTPAYMAPEQLRGEPGDARADVFGAAVVLFQTLAGRLPFPVVDGRSTVLDPGPPPPLPLDDPPPELASLLAGALSKDPTGRPQSAAALREALEAVERAYADRAAAQVRAARRHRLRRAAAAASLVALAAASFAAVLALRASAHAERALRSSRIASAAEGASDPLAAALLMAELEADPPPRAVEIAHRILAEPIPIAVLERVKVGVGLEVSPDGERIATGTADGGAVLYRSDGTGAPLVVSGGGKRTNALAFTRDGVHLVTAGHDGDLHVFRSDGAGAPRTLHAGGSPIARLRLDPSGRTAAAGTLDGRLWLADLDGRRPPRALLLDAAVLALAWSPDGAQIAAGGADGFVHLFAADGARLARTPLAGGAVLDLAWSPDGSTVAIASEDGIARMLGSDGAVRARHGEAGAPIGAVAFDPSGARIVVASGDGTARIHALGGGGRDVVLRGHRGPVGRAAFMPDGRHVLTSGLDGTARLWSAEGVQPPLVLRGHHVAGLAIAPDGGRVFTKGKDGAIRVWRAADPRDRGVLRVGDDALVDTVAWTRDGRRLLTAAHDGSARLWPIHGGEPLVLRDPAGVIHSADLDPAERRIVTASEDGAVRLWDAASGALVRELRGHEGPVLSAFFSPDGSRIASVSLDRTVRVWPADGDGAPLVLRGSEGGVTSVAWMPGGREVVSSSQLDGAVRVWRLDGGAPRVLRLERAVFRASPMPDGTLLVAEEGGPLHVLRPDGTERPFPALQEELFTAVSSPDGRRIALGSSDGTVRVYAADGSGEPLVLRGHVGPVGHAAFSPDGTELATAAWDGTARVATIDWGRLRAELRAVTSACLPVAHRTQVLGETSDDAEARFAACERAHGRAPSAPAAPPAAVPSAELGPARAGSKG